MRVSERRMATSYYAYDGGGNVRALIDPSGTITDTYAYDAFGNTVAHVGSTTNESQYRGEQFDAQLQMYYLRARYYRPQFGRFLTEDTSEGDDDDPKSQHRSIYTQAEPVNAADPSGHDIVDVGVTEGESAPVAGRFGNVVLRATQKLGCLAVDLGLQTLESEVLNEIVSLGINRIGGSFVNPQRLWNVGFAEIAPASEISEVAGAYALNNTATRKVVAVYINEALADRQAVAALINNLKAALGKDVQVLLSRTIHVEQKLINAAGGDFIISLGSKVGICDKCIASLAESYQKFGLPLEICR